MLHRFRTKPIEGQPICENVFIDDLCVECGRYEVIHEVGNVAKVVLEIPIIPNIDINAKIKIGNLSEIATVMDEDTFKEFKKLWSQIHN